MSKRVQQIEAFFRQGQQLHAAGRLVEAEQIYRQVLVAVPRHAEALHAMAALALQSGRPDTADTLLLQAIALKPAATFQLTRAHALLALHRPDEAAQLCRLVLRARPNSAEAHQVLGHALTDSNQIVDAITAYRQALRLNPSLPDIHNNLGTALRHANRLEEAEAQLRLAPRDPNALVNLSSVQKERGAFTEAEATLRQALDLAPRDPVLLHNWALLMLLLGRTEDAWDGWEQRFRANAVPPRTFTQPQWQGDALGRRRLLVHAEQGFGDMIQFARYLPAIEGATVFEVPLRLMRLLSSNPAMPPMLAPGAACPDIDVVAPLLSLPGRMRQVTVNAPYLFAELDRVSAWRARLPRDGLRIGIAWQGNPNRHEDKGRSLPLSQFAPLAAIPGVVLISLQKGDGEEQIPRAGFPLTTLAGLDDGPDAFVDTAAVMMSLDLIITSDTSIAHLAGALGRPVWVALRRVPDWRWLLDRADSPWYPTMRLFRQTAHDDWPPVFAAIANAIRAKCPPR
jgi:Flp pilus assembly protein TadD